MQTYVSNSPASIISYQNELVKTGQITRLGRMKMISIGPNAGCEPNALDPIMAKWGRLMQLRDRALPIAQSPDGSMILVCAPLVDPMSGYVKLPDLPDPTWKPPSFTREEVIDSKLRDPAKDIPRMIPQNLRDRAEGFLEGTTFLVFSPVLSISFQPEQNGQMLGTFWAVNCTHNPADRTDPTLLIDEKTGETHFYGGLYDIVRAVGEN